MRKILISPKSSGFVVIALLSIIVIAGIFFRFLPLNYPITYDEAQESYTTYSLIKTGKDTNGQKWPFIFMGENNYPSTLAIYTRVPFIWLFGLNNLGVRIPTNLIGSLSIFIFIALVYSLRPSLPFLEDKKLFLAFLFISTLIFSLSPWLIETHKFHLKETVSFTLILTGLILLFKYSSTFPSILGGLFLFFAPFSSIISFPYVFIILFYKALRLKVLAVLLLFSLILFAAIFFKFSGYGSFLIQESIIHELQPSTFTYLIDQRLAADFVQKSPLYTEKFNFNRIIHNKPFYAANNFFRSAISPFNFELLAFSLQSHSITILGSERVDPKAFPKIFFWEIPLFLLGIILLIVHRKPIISLLGIAGLSSALVFYKNDDGFFYTLPFLILVETLAIVFVFNKLKNIMPRISVTVLTILFFTFCQLSVLDLLVSHQTLWFPENDLRQWQIWNFVKDKINRYDLITVTDKLGEPINYFLFYNQFPPDKYQKDRRLGGITPQMVRQVSGVDGIKFQSFKYLESDRKPRQLYLGLAGEFVGRFHQYKNVSDISDGKILEKIPDVKYQDPFFGDELWIVETNF
jgi:hypothetical protein